MPAITTIKTKYPFIGKIGLKNNREISSIFIFTCNRESLKNVTEKWLPEVVKYVPDVPLILVGTKQDLRDNKEYVKKEGIEPITYTEGHNLANENGFESYEECSVFNEKKRAKELQKVFETAIRAVLKKPVEKKQKKSKCVML